jgi:transposase
MEFLIPATDSVRLLSQLMEELDYSKLYKAYSRTGRNPAVSPKNLFKVLVYGYMNNIYTSRALETACRRDVNFMWLLEGQAAPDHNTIARFRSRRLEGVVQDLFNQMVLKLHELDEIAFENIFIDGTKIEACANKYSFVWKKSTDKNEAKLHAKVKNIFERLMPENPPSELTTAEEMSELLEVLSQRATEQGMEFASGKGSRKTQLQRDIELLTECIEKQRSYDRYNSLFDGRNSFSKTDTDATFMHMKEDHMRNSQLKPGYNVQLGIEGEYIVGVDISSERNDYQTLVPFLKLLEESYQQKFQNIVADAGYESEENYAYLESTGQTAYIKPQNYEKSKERKYAKDISKWENMKYDPATDVYTCANGKSMNYICDKHIRHKSGYVSESKVYECEDCFGCPLKVNCTKAKGNKHMEVASKFYEYRAQSLERITSPKGILLRMNRSIQAEGTFGVLKEDHGYRRFLMRGKKNVRIEYLLLAIGFNVNKLHNKIQDRRCNQLLHQKEIA